jgi:hypothetical protein
MDDRQVTRKAPQRPAWQTLAEFGLSSKDGIEGAAVWQVTRVLDRLGMPPKPVAQINSAVAQAAREVMGRCEASEPRPRLSIRVVGLKFGGNGADNQLTAGRPKPTVGPALPGSCPDEQSWGFFLVGRTAATSMANGGRADYTIDLFIYPEGSYLGQTIF